MRAKEVVLVGKISRTGNMLQWFYFAQKVKKKKLLILCGFY